MKEYLQSSDEVLSAQKTSKDGLSTSEAKKRLETYGKNKLKEAKKSLSSTNSSRSSPIR